MTDTANNDKPSETPNPPEGYETWLELVLGKLGDCYWSDTRISDEDISCARAELAALRAKAAAYDAMTKNAPGTGCVGPGEMEIPT